jgi:hypothetical protein
MKWSETQRRCIVAGIVLVSLLGVVIIVPLFLSQKPSQPRPLEEALRNLKVLKLLEEQYCAEKGRYAPDPDGTAYYKVGNTGIQNALPDFHPSSADKNNFEYKITSFDKGMKFSAVASGKAGTPVAGIILSFSHNSRSPEETVISKGNLISADLPLSPSP